MYEFDMAYPPYMAEYMPLYTRPDLKEQLDEYMASANKSDDTANTLNKSSNAPDDAADLQAAANTAAAADKSATALNASTAAHTDVAHISATANPSYAANSPSSAQTPAMANTPVAAQAPPQVQPVWKDLLYLLAKIAAIALVFALMFTYLFGAVRYGEPSMSPAVKDGDLVIYYRYKKSGYSSQDLAVVEIGGKKQVRRVVAAAGDTVDILDGGLIINRAFQQEPGIYQRTERYRDGVEFPLTVPEGHVFVLGDRREGATDSRIYGCVSIDDTHGKVMAIIRRRDM